MRINRSTKIILITLIIIIVFIVIKVFALDIYTVKSENSELKHYVLVLKTKSVDKNDLVLVNNHYTEKLFISRIVAVGYDTVTIKQGNLYVNSILQKNSEATYNYRINAFSENAFLLLKDKYKLIDKENLLGVYFLNLQQKIIDSLNNDSVFIIRKEILENGIVNKKIFPQSHKYRWNEDNFGPLNIKKKGSVIDMNKQNYNLYKNTLKAYEEVTNLKGKC